MKNFYFFIGMVLYCLMFCESSHSQTGKINNGSPIVTNVSRYKVDFEIENFQFTSSTDSSAINTLNLDLYEELRLIDTDISIEIIINGIEQNLILYSVNKAGLRKSSGHPYNLNH